MLVGLGVSVLWPTTLGITANRLPQSGATMFALLAAAGNMGCMAAPWITGIVGEKLNLHVALLIGATFPLLLAATTLAAHFSDKRAMSA